MRCIICTFACTLTRIPRNVYCHTKLSLRYTYRTSSLFINCLHGHACFKFALTFHLTTHPYTISPCIVTRLLPLWSTVIILVDGFHHLMPLPDAAHLTDLYCKANQFLIQGLAPSTITTYSAGKNKYIQFCTASRISPIPSSETTLILFASYLATANMSHTTIKVYLAAIRHMHVVAGLHERFSEQLTSRLQLVLRGIKKAQASTSSPRVRLPITLQLIQSIKNILSNQPHLYRNIMLWAACCLAFFGFLRVSEFTIPSHNGYDPSLHLSLQDISIDHRDNPNVLRIHVKQSKTDPFRQGVQIYLGATNTNVCPILGILPYLALRRTQPGPLFLTENGQGLTRQIFCTALNSVLSELQDNCNWYNSHSFHIGTATTTAKANIPDAYIKMLGRWQSDAYQRYIKTPPCELAKFSTLIASASSSIPQQSDST